MKILIETARVNRDRWEFVNVWVQWMRWRSRRRSGWVWMKRARFSIFYFWPKMKRVVICKVFNDHLATPTPLKPWTLYWFAPGRMHYLLLLFSENYLRRISPAMSIFGNRLRKLTSNKSIWILKHKNSKRKTCKFCTRNAEACEAHLICAKARNHWNGIEWHFAFYEYL